MKVSVVIPTYKRTDYLARLLDSVASQTFDDFEVIVVDDNSPNSTEYDELVERYSELFTSFRFYRNSSNSGAPFSRNFGISKATGDLIALVDDDDIWMPTKLEKQVALFDQGDDHLGLVYTWTHIVNENLAIIGEYNSTHEGNCKTHILSECFIPSPSVMVRKRALMEAGLFDVQFPSCQDWDMWTRILFSGFTCDVVKDYVTQYFKHSGPTIGTSPKAKVGYLMYYQKHLSKLIRYAKIRHIVRFIKLKWKYEQS